MLGERDSGIDAYKKLVLGRDKGVQVPLRDVVTGEKANQVQVELEVLFARGRLDLTVEDSQSLIRLRREEEEGEKMSTEEARKLFKGG